MRRLTLIILSSILIISCGQNRKEEPIEEIPVSEHYTWTASLDDSTGNLKMVPGNPIPDDSLNKEYILAFLNNRFVINGSPLIKIEFVKQAGDTIYIRIPDATYLTQQSGSTGAEEHMGTMLYNLTEIPGVKYVMFEFEEGDHAQPGLYRRDSLQIGIQALN